MARKPRTEYVVMSYRGARKRFPELREELKKDRDFALAHVAKQKFFYCLHCDKTIETKDVKTAVLVFKKTGLSVPADDKRYQYEGRVYTLCSTPGCDGGPFDWKETPWPTSEDYDKFDWSSYKE